MSEQIYTNKVSIVHFHIFMSFYSIYAILLRIRFCRDLRFFCVNFWGQKLRLRNFFDKYDVWQWNLEPPQCLCFNSLVYLATWTLNIFVFYLNSRSQSKAQIWGITNGESPSLSDLEMIALESSIGSQGKIIPSSPTPRIDDFGSGNLRVCCEDDSYTEGGNRGSGHHARPMGPVVRGQQK